MDWLESLNIRGLISIKNLDCISNLQHLVHLNIGSSSKLENIEGLSTLKKLITLQIEGFKMISDITPITKITSLKGLHINGDMWKKQYLNSVEGINKLNELEYLSLDGTEVHIKDITPITKLKKLKNLEVGYWWRKDDLENLYKSLPFLMYGSVKKAVESGEYEKYLKK
jgi:Leucine-rich repeat (LRR) protein